MMKYGIGCLFVVGALMGFATAQSSQPRSYSAKSSPDPLKTATKPLTPKSAMRSHRRAAVATPKAAASTSKTTTQLTHLERQNSKAGTNSGNTAPAKSAPLKLPGSSGSSKIDFKYQKPADGQKATPSATATPRKP